MGARRRTCSISRQLPLRLRPLAQRSLLLIRLPHPRPGRQPYPLLHLRPLAQLSLPLIRLPHPLPHLLHCPPLLCPLPALLVDPL